MNIVVVGSGPAGIAAATTAAEHGANVCIVDENPMAGGQIWRQGPHVNLPKSASAWIHRLQQKSVQTYFGYTVLGGSFNRIVATHQNGHQIELPYDALILATGARELFLPFPGWTLPNVMGCGGAQALLKSGMPVRGKRLVVSGSGPLLLAVAASFVKQGANLIGVFEQASKRSLLPFVFELARFPSKIWQGMLYAKQCFPKQIQTNSWISKATGIHKLEQVEVVTDSGKKNLDCDLLACGFGLIPNTELASNLGCKLVEGKVYVDVARRTSIPNIFCAGESTGIGGENVAILDGQIAAYSAINSELNQLKLASVLKQRMYWNGFVNALDSCFKPRREILGLSEDSTVICRCEDVQFGKLKEFSDQRSAKLHTRAGMGSCQGRICGPICHQLLGWNLNKARLPLSPATVESLQFFLDKQNYSKS